MDTLIRRAQVLAEHTGAPTVLCNPGDYVAAGLRGDLTKFVIQPIIGWDARPPAPQTFMFCYLEPSSQEPPGCISVST